VFVAETFRMIEGKDRSLVVFKWVFVAETFRMIEGKDRSLVVFKSDA
jgi:hypothetical protein